MFRMERLRGGLIRTSSSLRCERDDRSSGKDGKGERKRPLSSRIKSDSNHISIPTQRSYTDRDLSTISECSQAKSTVPIKNTRHLSLTAFWVTPATKNLGSIEKSALFGRARIVS